jgi:hypothetical protein
MGSGTRAFRALWLLAAMLVCALAAAARPAGALASDEPGAAVHVERPLPGPTLAASDHDGAAAALPETDHAGLRLCGEAPTRVDVHVRFLLCWSPRVPDLRSSGRSRARMLDGAARLYTHRLFFLRSGGSSITTTTPPPAH